MKKVFQKPTIVARGKQTKDVKILKSCANTHCRGG